MMTDLKLFWKYIQELRPYRFPLAVSVLSDSFSILLEMIPPLFSVLIFDIAYPQRNLPLLTSAVLAGLAIYFVRFFFTTATDYNHTYIDQKYSSSLASRLFQKVMKLPMASQARQRLGDLTVRILDDTDLSAGVIVNSFFVLFMGIFRWLLFFTIVLLIDPFLTLLALLSVPLYALETRFYSGRLEGLQIETRNKESDIYDGLQERLGNLRTIKAFAREKEESDQFENLLFSRVRLSLKERVISIISSFTNSITLQLWGTFILWFIGYEVIRGSISIGQAVALGMYLPLMEGPIRELSNLFTQFKVGLVSLKRMDDILCLPDEEQQPISVKKNAEISQGEIEFQKVYFQYEPTLPVLKGFDLQIQSGSTLAIVGESGSGKSTLLNLLLRFYEPTEGMILFDGKKVQELKLQSLRNKIGVVFQEISLFAGTIRENIIYGHPNASDDEVIRAARMGAAHEFVTKLPNSYNTYLERYGQNLSGGQRQRLAIARALLLKPKILILDEATSALDAESEFLIQETIHRCKKEMTIIFVAHRLSSIKSFDKIIVLQNGHIAEQGNFRELMDKKAVFYGLYNLQFSSPEEFFRHLHIESERTRRYKQGLSVLAFEVQNYEQLRHELKEESLKKLMEHLNLKIQRVLRVMDFSSVFLGNKIIAALPETSKEGAAQLGVRIEKLLKEDPIIFEGRPVSVKTRFGVSTSGPEEGFFPEELVEKAEEDLIQKRRKDESAGKTL